MADRPIDLSAIPLIEKDDLQLRSTLVMQDGKRSILHATHLLCDVLKGEKYVSRCE
jgi:hypothetical protein